LIFWEENKIDEMTTAIKCDRFIQHESDCHDSLFVFHSISSSEVKESGAHEVIFGAPCTNFIEIDEENLKENF